MPTLPDWSIDEHIEFELNLLRKSVPDLKASSIRCFEFVNLDRSVDPDGVFREKLPFSALGDLDAFRALIARLSDEGRGWIHFSGAGALPSGEYLISVDYSDRTGVPATYIVTGGTNCEADGSPIRLTSIKIIPTAPESEEH